MLELLTVVAVIAILAAIAIPQYTGYRIRANDSAALSDLRNLYGAMEATVTDTQSYPALATTLSGQVSIGSAYYSTSSRVAISLRSSQTGFAATACHQSGGHEYGTGGGQEYTGASGAILRRATATTGCTPSTVESASTLPGSGWN